MKWFSFPTESEGVRILAEEHAGKSVICMSTPLPEDPGISLVQVLTFVDPVLGYRHVFSEETCRDFLKLALSVHAGLHMRERLELATLVKAAEPAASVFGANSEELFLLVPTRVATLAQEQIEGLLELPDAVMNPLLEPTRSARMLSTPGPLGAQLQ